MWKTKRVSLLVTNGRNCGMSSKERTCPKVRHPEVLCFALHGLNLEANV